MKMFLSLAVLSLSFTAAASSMDTKTFIYDGSQDSVELMLRAEKTHTEYVTEDVESTCYRREIVGHTSTCIGGNYRPYPRGYPGNFPGGYYDPRNRYPQPGPYFPGSRTCVQQPIYRSVPYICMRTVQNGYEVKDYDVEAKVSIDVSKVSQALANEKFTVVLAGDLITISAVGSKNYLVVQASKSIKSKMEGAVKTLDASYKVELVEAAPVLDSLKMNSVKIEDGLLKFDLGSIANPNDLAVSLNIEKRLIGDDRVLINRELAMNEIALSATRRGTEVIVDVDKLGVILENGKFELTPKVSFKPKGTLLNRVQFGEEALSTSRTLIYKIR